VEESEITGTESKLFFYNDQNRNSLILQGPKEVLTLYYIILYYIILYWSHWSLNASKLKTHPQLSILLVILFLKFV